MINKKSTLEQLHKRGFIKDSDIAIFQTYTDEEMFKMLSSPSATSRSAAVVILSEKGYIHNIEFVDKLITMLQAEKKLYTRLYICTTLGQGDDEVAKKLLPCLGRIGSNQHHEPGKTSKKRSYPLARDIVARTLCNMKLSQEFLVSLFNLEGIQLREAIDVIGWHLFYHEYDNLLFYNGLQRLLHTSQEQTLLWKCLTCCSGLPYVMAKELVQPYLFHSHIRLQEEARRSLLLSKERGKS